MIFKGIDVTPENVVDQDFQYLQQLVNYFKRHKPADDPAKLLNKTAKIEYERRCKIHLITHNINLGARQKRTWALKMYARRHAES